MTGKKSKYVDISERGLNPFGVQSKILWHMDRLVEFLKTGSSFPIEIEANPTNFCNMECKWCISSYSHKPEFVEKDVLFKFLKEYKEMGGKTIIWSGGGEPTTYKYFKEAIEEAKGLGIKQGLMTNGFFKKELREPLAKNMEWIRFSLDTNRGEKYIKWKGSDCLSIVCENIKNLCNDNRTRVTVNMNLADWNEEDIISTAKLAKSLGADAFQIRPILGRPYDTEDFVGQNSELVKRNLKTLKELEKMSDEKMKIFISWDKFFDVLKKDKGLGRNYNKCQYHNFICVLNANGDFCVCMYHLGDDRFTFGNINKQSLKEIWESEKRKRVIDFCNNGGIDFNTCQVCCKGHELNKILHFIQNRNEKSDPDFL